MSKKCPDKWVILEFTSEKHGTFKKILSSWFGGYLGGDSWNLSSPIINFDTKDSYYEIKTESSIYVCHKNNYGMSSYTSSVYERILESAKSKNISLTIIKETELIKCHTQQ